MIEQSGDPKLILVMAQDGDTARRRCVELTLAGYRIVLAESLDKTLTALRGNDPQAILFVPPIRNVGDLDVPGILREVEPMSYLPLLVELPDEDEKLRCEYFCRGADDVIDSQTSGDELAARCRSVLRVKAVHDQLTASRVALQESLDRERKLLAKLRKDNATLLELCTTDPLTRLQNVRSFRDILAHEYRIATRYNQPLSLLMMDVDHFKMVNDLYGHPAGDFVLKELAVILTRSVRSSDVVARTGGEEFSVILPKADIRRCLVMAQRIRREVAAHHFAAYGLDIRATISIGTASHPADAEITDEPMMIYMADQALLAAKEGGRNRVVAMHDLVPSVRQRLRRQYQQNQETAPCQPVAKNEKTRALSSK